MKDDLIPDLSGIDTSLESNEPFKLPKPEPKKKKKRTPTRKSKMCVMLNKAIDDAKRKRGIKESLIVPSKLHENSASMVERCIIEYIKLMPNSYAFKVSGSGVMRKGKWTTGGGTNGISDVIALVQGRMLCIEVKFSDGDKQRKGQVRFEGQIKQAGGSYLIVRNFTDFLPKFKQWFKPSQIVKQTKLQLK